MFSCGNRIAFLGFVRNTSEFHQFCGSPCFERKHKKKTSSRFLRYNVEIHKHMYVFFMLCWETYSRLQIGMLVKWKHTYVFICLTVLHQKHTSVSTVVSNSRLRTMKIYRFHQTSPPERILFQGPTVRVMGARGVSPTDSRQFPSPF